MRVNHRVALALSGALAVAMLAACSSGGSTTASSNPGGVLNVGMPNGP